MRFRHLRLTMKLVLLLLAFGVIPLGIVGIIAYESTSVIEQQNTARFEAVATNIADKIDRNLFERYGDVQAFGLNQVIDNRDAWGAIGADGNRIVRAMDRYVDTYDIYYLTFLVDLEGRMIAVNSRDADGKPIKTEALYRKNFRHTPWFQALQAGQFTTRMPFTASGNDVSTGTFIEDVHLDPDVQAVYPGGDGLTLGFAAPVYRDGKVIAYWSNRAKFSIVEQIFQTAYSELKAQGYPGAELTLLDSTGRILVDLDPRRTGTETIQHDFNVIMKLNLAEKGIKAAQEAIAGKTGHGFSVHARKNIEQAGGYAHLKGALGYPGMNWAVLVRIPRVEASAGIFAIRHNILITVGITLGLTLALGLFIGRRFSTPLVAMAHAASQIAVGNINQHVTYTSGDETGTLASAFRSLTDYIKSLASAADALCRGDMSTEVVARSEQDVLSANFQQVTTTLRDVISETAHLVEAAKAGQLNRRGDASRFTGGYHEIVQGINDLLETVVAPINEAAVVLKRVAARDLRTRMQGNYQGDFAAIKEALNTAISHLDESLIQVASGAEQVAAASGQISSGSQALARGASGQASTLQEISSSLQEMASMSQQNASNAQEARGLATDAQHSADQGTESMQRLSRAIDDIKVASDETAKIVKTINEIAFQTNLLALNAAVEAARAGDAGKGFAVVAEEVRNLAMRSAEAARNSAHLIDQAVLKAGDGVALNQEVLGNLEKIVKQVHQVSEVMREIATASEQQQQGVEQLHIAVGQLNQVTQQTAANADEAASTAEELSDQAAEMQHMIRTFHLSHMPVDAASAPAPLAHPHSTPPAQDRLHQPLSPANGHAMPTVPRDFIAFDDDEEDLQDF